MSQNYWSSIVNHRVARRRALALTGSTAAGALLLAACGGGNDDTSDKSSLVAKEVDTSKQAKRGGTIRWYHANNEPTTLDITAGNGSIETDKSFSYSQLVRLEPGYLKPTEFNVGPDIAQSWELSPDKTQLTFTLRPNVKWHNIAPVNGRTLDTEDVLFSWERLAKMYSGRTLLSNAVNPEAPVVSMSAPDSKTIVVKMNKPNATILALLANKSGGNLNLVPKETDSTLDLRKTFLGTGPYMLSNYTPSVSLTFKRHAEFYDKDRTFADQIDMPIVPEYATALGQLRAGNIYSYVVRPEDILQQKKDIPELNLYTTDVISASQHVTFGWLPENKSPWLDKRVRQAYSLSWNRDEWTNTFNDVERFESQGLPVETFWNTSLSAEITGWWLNPKSKDFGPNAKWFLHDIAEAKKLLAAAGYPNGLDYTATFHYGGTYNSTQQAQMDVLEGYAKEAGFRGAPNGVDLATIWDPKYKLSLGQFEGVGLNKGASGAGGLSDSIALHTFEYSARGGTGFYGFNGSGQSAPSGDTEVEAMLDKAKLEFDVEKRKAINFDIQRYLAEKMYLAFWPGGATGFILAWPVVRNFNVYRGEPVPPRDWWIDESQAPLKKA